MRNQKDRVSGTSGETQYVYLRDKLFPKLAVPTSYAVGRDVENLVVHGWSWPQGTLMLV